MPVDLRLQSLHVSKQMSIDCRNPSAITSMYVEMIINMEHIHTVSGVSSTESQHVREALKI